MEKICQHYRELISTHSLTRRLTVTDIKGGKQDEYFNSQPHKEADDSNRYITAIRAISTHSLTRRLTFTAQ